MDWDAGNVVEVKLPPLFVNFAARKAPINQHYQALREESEQWLIKTCKFDTNMASFVHKTDFGYFVAIVAPDAEEDELRIMFDWGNWGSETLSVDEFIAMRRGSIATTPLFALFE
ncbi:terpene synthase metal binding domain protein [Aspergillus luchuensis]|uniref:Terpene synthase metal binding domain protein n=1 Tax=Aspergillus kawachii TaxID=1069201 RepID=A0A146FR41_ASPKA|nr:terpene synthase metal binding domain protein [Aspergillus luchuensis]